MSRDASVLSAPEQIEDELLMFPRRWLELTVGNCVREFEFATLACNHNEIMHLLGESLKEGSARGNVGSIDTSTVRTRALDNAIRSVINLGGGPQSAEAHVLLQWAKSVRDLRHAIVDRNWDRLQKILEDSGKNNIIPENSAEWSTAGVESKRGRKVVHL